MNDVTTVTNILSDLVLSAVLLFLLLKGLEVYNKAMERIESHVAFLERMVEKCYDASTPQEP